MIKTTKKNLLFNTATPTDDRGEDIGATKVHCLTCGSHLSTELR